jgi:hypothetical protein
VDSLKASCLALLHQWEPVVVLGFVFTGYFDESGTHDGSDVTIMSGMLARADQWKKFDAGFAATQKRHGFRVFHTKKFKAKRGDFVGWSNEQCGRLIADLANLGAYGLTDCVSVTLRNAMYDKFYKGASQTKARLDSKYGLCFRMCLTSFMLEVLKRSYKKRIAPLYIVLEAGHPNVGDAERIFWEMKKEYDDLGVNMLQSVTKADKDSCGQLMMADFIAHTTYMVSTGVAPTPQSTLGPTPRKGPMTVHHLESTPEAMASLLEIANLAARRLRREKAINRRRADVE